MRGAIKADYTRFVRQSRIGSRIHFRNISMKTAYLNGNAATQQQGHKRVRLTYSLAAEELCLLLKRSQQYTESLPRFRLLLTLVDQGVIRSGIYWGVI